MNHLRPLRPTPRPILLVVLVALIAALLLLAHTDLGADPAAPDAPSPADFRLPGA